ncbi:hypothetical protein N7492_009172 [Penicillium capsulatum]|uniref:RTA1 domain protein n=1 Tax=Penicillium capsulatum TaxID=69766 RepID=A0A9W9HU25_9EURO|nr:hypothetical protein N7492_009172 [Penicillium capsulatum]
MASPTTTSTSATSTPTCLDIEPGKNGYLPPEACDVILFYAPSFGAAILFCVLFGLTTMAHLFQAVQYKKLLSVSELGNVNYTLSFTNIETPGINAFLYMTLGRMINFFIPEKRFWGVSAPRFGTIFVCLDIFAFLIQLAGAFMTSGDDDNQHLIKIGLHIYMGGIGAQEAFVLVFVALTIHLHLTLIKTERSGQSLDKLSRGMFSWHWLFYSIYFALAMITVRIIFRLAQYGQGYEASNPILTHEWFEYVLDAAPMFLALLALNIIHPGRILQGEDAKFQKLTRAEKKQRKIEKKMAKKEKNKKEWTESGDEPDDEVPLQSPTAQERTHYGGRYYEV